MPFATLRFQKQTGGAAGRLVAHQPTEQKEYFTRALDFIKHEVGEHNIISAIVHMDENSPHMHLCFTPITQDKRLSAKEIIGNKPKLIEWQDRFHAYISQRRLEGPEINSKDYYFHYRLASLSGNPLFVSFIDTYYDLIRQIRDLNLQVQDRSEHIRKEHLRIVDALRKRDKAAARRATKSHLSAVAKLIGTRL